MPRYELYLLFPDEGGVVRIIESSFMIERAVLHNLADRHGLTVSVSRQPVRSPGVPSSRPGPDQAGPADLGPVARARPGRGVACPGSAAMPVVPSAVDLALGRLDP